MKNSIEMRICQSIVGFVQIFNRLALAPISLRLQYIFFCSLPAFFPLIFRSLFSNMWLVFSLAIYVVLLFLYILTVALRIMCRTNTYCLLNTKIYTDWQSVSQAISFYSNYIAVIQNRNVIEPKWM